MLCVRISTSLSLVILVTTGCGKAETGDHAAPRVERATVDGVEQVRTVSGSAWQEQATLVEEMSFGVAEGDQVYMFGQVSHVVPDGKGGAYVFDRQVPVLRHYDSTGWHTRTIGRAGSGPGEYQSDIMGLAVLSDDRIVLLDPRNARFNVYAPDGTALAHWPRLSGLFTSRAMYVDRDDNIYTRVMTAMPQAGAPMPPVGLMRLSSKGEVLDTLPAPAFAGEPVSFISGLMPTAKIWDYHRDGYPIVGINDKYLIELRKPEGTLRIERAAERVAVQPEERAEREATMAYVVRMQGGRGPALAPMPDLKPYFRALYGGEDGSIWVHLYQHAVRHDQPLAQGIGRDPGPDGPPPIHWIEPTVFDVFDPDGTYLGAVNVPRGMTLRTFSRGRLWATREGPQGEIVVTRLRLVEPVR